MNLEQTLRFVALFCSGIAVGGWLVVLLAVVPTRRSLPAAFAIELHQKLSERIDRYMPQCTFAAIIAGILLLALRLNASAPEDVLTGVGVAGLACSAAISLGWNMPTNRLIAKWPPDAAPADHATLLEKWSRTHALRTLSGVIAFSAYIASALVR